MNLAASRSKALSKARKAKNKESRSDTLDQIYQEGFEDYSYGEVAIHPYKGEEAFAYRNGWEAAHAQSEAAKI